MTSMYFGGVVGPDKGLHRLLDKLLLQLRLAEHQAPRPPPDALGSANSVADSMDEMQSMNSSAASRCSSAFLKMTSASSCTAPSRR
eukprot:scaffold140876_cov205-Phaeocystis_antarctica.AAC.1